MKTISTISIGFASIGVVMFTVIPLRAQAAEESLTPAEFVYRASESGIVDVAAGRIAIANSKSADVQRYALTSIANRDTANDELKILARKKGLTFMDEAAAQEKVQNAMDSVKPENFDKTYAIDQVKAHEQAVDLFAEAAGQVGDEDLQNYAREKLPILRRNLETARELVKKRGGE